MKYNFLLFGISLGCLFASCKPDFNLNASYKDIPVVYGILNYQDSIHYVKIYKGYQTNEQGAAFIDAQNPDSIYYYNNIIAVLEEYDENYNRTQRPEILLEITDKFDRDSGIFCYKEDRIIYYTTETIYKDKIYNIKITNKINGNITQGKTDIVNNFEIANNSSTFSLLEKTSSVAFTSAINAADRGYEIHVNFIYFEVDIRTNEVKIFKIIKNITPQVGEAFKSNIFGEIYKEFTPTFYDDIANQVKPNPNVKRYQGLPGGNGTCIEIEGWAAGEGLYNFLLSNKPTSSFVQINTRYTNLTSSDGVAFGFLSSRIKCPTKYFAITDPSQDTLISGSKTYQLGFHPWTEYKP